MKRQTMKRFTLYLLPLALLLGACSEEAERPEADENDQSTVRTEPAEFRQTLADSLPLEVPDPEIGANRPTDTRPDGDPAAFGVASARIEFRVTGDRRGKMIHEFREYGRYNRQYDSTVAMKKNDPNGVIHELSITNPRVIGKYNYLTDSGWGIVNKAETMIKEQAAMTQKTAFDLYVAGTNAEKLTDTTINGYETEVYRTDIGPLVQTTWFWRHIPIRMHYFAPYDDLEWTYEPMKIELNPTFPQDHFLFTDDYNIRMQVAPPAPGVAPPPPALTDPRGE